MQPDQYQFQSIGTNALPPGIHGSFLRGGPYSGPYPTALPQRLTQGKYSHKICKNNIPFFLNRLV